MFSKVLTVPLKPSTSQFISPSKTMGLRMSEEGITAKTPCLDI